MVMFVYFEYPKMLPHKSEKKKNPKKIGINPANSKEYTGTLI